MTKFSAFYTTEPFWGGEAPKFGDSGVVENATEVMSQQIFSHISSKYALHICKDGLIMLRIEELEEQISEPVLTEDQSMEEIINWWQKYVEYLNCLYLMLDSSFMEIGGRDNSPTLNFFPLSRQRVLRIEYEEGNFQDGSLNTTQPGYANRFKIERFLSPQPTRPKDRFPIRPELSQEVFDLLIDKFEDIPSGNKLRRRLSSITKSISEFKLGNYEISLILSWFVIESKLDKEWNQVLQSKNKDYNGNLGKRINVDRRQRLTNGRDYSVSVVSNILELFGPLDYELFKSIDEVRSIRNKIVHREPNFECTERDCIKAIELAITLITKEKDLTLSPDLSYGLSYQSP